MADLADGFERSRLPSTAAIFHRKATVPAFEARSFAASGSRALRRPTTHHDRLNSPRRRKRPVQSMRRNT
ncbi:hypothetical protein [Burkholderia stabilis]|uniref:hypothetical protein n=1 Tax=Burkholderia stabilis TaxID=95485 RepID=UPI001013B0DC|nr:hypothetical protein [Burkholderia stabilis]